MSAVNQEALKRAGTRDAYLRGDITLAESKRTLRPQAIALNVAKPIRPRGSRLPAGGMRTSLKRMIAQHIKNVVRDEGRPLNPATVDREIVWLDDESPDMERWNYGQVKYAGRKGSEYERTDYESGRVVIHNPFWYH
jgi:hypothetical protein